MTKRTCAFHFGKKYPKGLRSGKKCRSLLAACLLAAGGLGIVGAFQTAAAQSAASPKVTLTFADEALLDSGKIRLGDIARIESNDADLRRKLGELVIGDAPRVGQTVNQRSDSVRLLLRRDRNIYGITDTEVAFNGAASVRVRVDSQTIEPDALMEPVRAWLEEKAKETYGAERVEVEYSMKQQPVAVPKGVWSVEPQWKSLPNRLVSVLSFPVNITVDGTTFQSLYMALKLHAYRTVAVASQPITRFEEIAPVDVELKEMDLTTLVGDIPTGDPMQVIGWRATRALRAGEIITRQNSESMPLIQKGDQVTLYLESALMRLVSVGEAQQDGRNGEMIRIKNLRSGQMVRGMVVGERFVRVQIPAFRTAVFTPTRQLPTTGGRTPTAMAK